MPEEKIAKNAAKTKTGVKDAGKPKRSLLRRKKVEVKQEVQGAQDAQDPFAIIKYVVMTEKAIHLIESQNKLVLVVDRGATKSSIKKAVEGAFSARISNVQTMIDQSGRKKAFVKFIKEGEAGEIAIRLGVI